LVGVLRAEFPGCYGTTLVFQPAQDMGTTGNFEIVVDGVLVHSKRNGTGGKCTTQKERDYVVAKIKEAFLAKGLPVPHRDEAAYAAAVSERRKSDCSIC
jgi:hypothetical protein